MAGMAALVEARQPILDRQQEARGGIGANALDFAQRIEEAVALLVRVGLARVFEQFFLELAERREQRMGEDCRSPARGDR
jgi:hypothetical protein